MAYAGPVSQQRDDDDNPEPVFSDLEKAVDAAVEQEDDEPEQPSST